ncbi:MAG: AAA family ATPase [Candidatus Sericytochromatia bacterium]
MDNLEENKLEDIDKSYNQNYWLLEATWHGGNEHANRYITEGVWVNIFSSKTKEFNEIKLNDCIAVKTSISKEIEDGKFISAIKIKAIGIVTKNLRDGRHLEVSWKKEFNEPEIDNIIKNESIHKLEDVNEINNIFYKGKDVYKIRKIEDSETQDIQENIADSLEREMFKEANKRLKKRNFTQLQNKIDGFPLNQIFYGASGTGKTFKTISSALEIIDGFCPEDFNEAKERFDFYKELGQISFITFHNTYSYQDFIEGLISVEDANNLGKKEYRVRAGVFKEIANLAKVELLSADTRIDFNPDDEKINYFKITIGTNSNERDDQTYNYCLENGYISLDMLGGIDYSILENTKDWEQAKDEIGEIYFFEQSQDQKRLGIQSIYYFKNFMKKGDLVFVSNDHNRITSIGRVKGIYEFMDLAGIRYHHFRKVEWIIKECSIPSEKFYDKKFSDQIIYQLTNNNINKDNLLNFIGKNGGRKRNYVLIIDEINKGDIKNIFGEALTLIEPQKRLGQSEELKIRLPFSNDELVVPDNLFIIGTMNTPIQSEIFDQALRRRFDFIEMNINYEILNFKIDGIQIDKMLKMINKRLEFLIGENIKIGHAYFIELKYNPSFEVLRNIFKNKVIPLLQYLFNDDMEKISLVLADNQKKKNELKFIITEKIESKKLFGNSDIQSKTVYKINYPDLPKAYIEIY